MPQLDAAASSLEVQPTGLKTSTSQAVFMYGDDSTPVSCVPQIVGQVKSTT
jgi:hypothetical protein